VASKPKDPDPAGLFAYDRGLGSDVVIGADEAGRGCLAGPIVAAAVVFDRDCLESLGRGRLEGLNDSKKMTAKARERVFPEVMACAVRVSIAMRSARHIDAAGLHKSNIECLVQALRGAGGGAAATRLVDGFTLPGCELEHRRLVKGDSTSAAVAAASVIAKVTRDRYMTRAAGVYPEYGFDGHKGYGSEAHRAAIVIHGPCPLHRLSFNSDAYGEFGQNAPSM
jgi:ribonuclease HII